DGGILYADGDSDAENEIEIPDGGTNGQVLSIDGEGSYVWVANSGGGLGLSEDAPNSITTGTDGGILYADGDSDAENEIELPEGGINGDVLTTNSDGEVQWLPIPENSGSIENDDATLEEDRTVNQAGYDFLFAGPGNVGIGTTNPTNKLHVAGAIRAEGIRNTFGTLPSSVAYSFNGDPDTGMSRTGVDELSLITAGNPIMTLSRTGEVGIGVTAPTAKLHVAGDILATGTITPDYVFHKYYEGRSFLKPEYELMSLDEIEKFTKTNKHLPGVPSAREVERRGGILINRATEINLEKIEELFLHTIEQEKKIKELQSEKEALSEELQSLRKELEEIKAMLKKSK
ncbi:MAG TPA: hypothetical protein VFM69_00735, partial [Pricia sp.]|nr:hypothetical protein [Pricia sp.]